MAPPINRPIEPLLGIVGFGQLSIDAGPVIIAPPLHSAGVFALIGDHNQVTSQKAAGPPTNGAVVAYTISGFDAVYAESVANAVHAVSHTKNFQEAAILATNDAGGPAARFEGNVYVTGDVILSGADCAEDFDVAVGAACEPGTVMVMDDEGQLIPCSKAYDRRVAGVISGAGAYRPAMILDKQEGVENRSPVALFGKAFCRVDARFGQIEVGDLLTTSPHEGHAMKAADAKQAFGAIVGKALRPFVEGIGLVPILVALQ
jgi:hypothetical protein